MYIYIYICMNVHIFIHKIYRHKCILIYTNLCEKINPAPGSQNTSKQTYMYCHKLQHIATHCNTCSLTIKETRLRPLR